MTDKKTLAVVALMVVAVAFLVHSCRELDPAGHVGGMKFSMMCLECKKPCVLTADEMNGMVKRGECLSPPNEVRRFKCPFCGKLSVVPDTGIINELSKPKQ
jgi:hypothetical protein